MTESWVLRFCVQCHTWDAKCCERQLKSVCLLFHAHKFRAALPSCLCICVQACELFGVLALDLFVIKVSDPFLVVPGVMENIYTQVVYEDSQGDDNVMEYEVSAARSNPVSAAAPAVEKPFHTIHDPARPAPSIFLIGHSVSKGFQGLAQPVLPGPPESPEMCLWFNVVVCEQHFCSM